VIPHEIDRYQAGNKGNKGNKGARLELIRRSVAEQFGMGSRPYKIDAIGFQLVDQQEISTYVALPVVGPFTLQCVV